MKNWASVKPASKATLIALHAERDAAQVKAAIEDAFMVVTATGVANFVTARYGKVKTRARFVNLGVLDEIGDAFRKQSLFEGKPVNFCLAEPTTVVYLDPAFYVHNEAGALLARDAKLPAAQRAYKPRTVYALPTDMDDALVEEFERIHKEALPSIFDVPSALRQKASSTPSQLQSNEATKAQAKKSPAKKSPAKKSPAKKSPAKKSPAKKSPAKAKAAPAAAAAGKKSPAKKAAARNGAAKSPAAAKRAAPQTTTATTKRSKK